MRMKIRTSCGFIIGNLRVYNSNGGRYRYYYEYCDRDRMLNHRVG